MYTNELIFTILTYNISGVSELLHLITTNVMYIDNILIFIMGIPFVNSYKFILYKPIPNYIIFM